MGPKTKAVKIAIWRDKVQRIDGRPVLWIVGIDANGIVAECLNRTGFNSDLRRTKISAQSAAEMLGVPLDKTIVEN